MVDQSNPEAPLASIPTQSLFSLANTTVLVTGAARGLGVTISQAILESGGDVVGYDVLPEPVEPEWSQALALAKKHGTTISYAQLDITSEPQVGAAFKKAFAEARKDYPVMGLVNCAGVQLLKDSLQVTADEFRRIIDINLNGSFFVSQAFAREWQPLHSNATGSPGGPQASIVLIGSMSGSVANTGLQTPAYNASKAGVIQLARNLALEWSSKGIRINTISPGYIVTALTGALFKMRPELPDEWASESLMGRLSTPDEMRGTAIYLLSKASSFMTGSDVIIDGGHTAH